MPQFYISDWKENFFEVLYNFTIEKTNNNLQKAIMVFPTMRSKRIALEYFQNNTRNSFLPEMLTIPELLVYCQEAWLNVKLLSAKNIDSLESIALLYDIVSELAITENNKVEDEFNLYSRMLSYTETSNTFFQKELKSFKHFYSYGQYLHQIIQECFDENSKALSLPYAGEEMNEFSLYLLENLRNIFTMYHIRLGHESLSTKEYIKFCLAQKIEKEAQTLPLLFQNNMLFFCGLDQISGTEEACLQYFSKQNSFFLFSTDPKLATKPQNAHWSTSFYKEWATKWNINFELINVENKPKHSTQYYFHQAFDTHSQFQNLNLSKENTALQDTACIINSEESLTPLLYNLNNSFLEEDINVTMGYSLKNTNLYRLIYLFDKIKLNIRKIEVKAKVENEKNKKNKSKAKLEENSSKNKLYKLNFSEEKVYLRYADLLEYVSFSFFNIDNENLISRLKDELLQKESPYICINEELASESSLNALLEPLLLLLFEWFSVQSLANIVDFIFKLDSVLTSKLHDMPLERLALNKLIDKALYWQKKTRIIEENLGYELCASLVLDFLSSSSVAFEHHSNKAMQILGLRETKLLPIETVHIFDANDDVLPPRAEENPLLPEKMRKAIGLKSIRANEVYTAHTWYRLLATAKTAHLYWQESSVKTLFDDKKIPSPYVEEALWIVEQEKGKILKPDASQFTQAQCVVELNPKTHAIPVTNEIRNAINAMCKHAFSPSKLDVFLSCPLRFFYQYIANFKAMEEVVEGEDARLLGNLVHSFMENIFPESNKKIDKSEVIARYTKEIKKFDEYVKNENLDKILPAESLFLLKTSFPYRMNKYLQNQEDSMKILHVEKQFSAKLNSNMHNNAFSFHGYIDRIDERQNEEGKQLILLDYKTGSVEKKIHSENFWKNDELFSSFLSSIKSYDEIMAQNLLSSLYKSSSSLQMPIYLFLTHQNNCLIDNAVYVDLFDTCKERAVLSQECDKDTIIGKQIPLILEYLMHYIENIKVFSKTEHSPCGWCPYSMYCG